jgi:hypothetical protein
MKSEKISEILDVTRIALFTHEKAISVKSLYQIIVAFWTEILSTQAPRFNIIHAWSRMPILCHDNNNSLSILNIGISQNSAHARTGYQIAIIQCYAFLRIRKKLEVDNNSIIYIYNLHLQNDFKLRACKLRK